MENPNTEKLAKRILTMHNIGIGCAIAILVMLLIGFVVICGIIDTFTPNQ